MLRFASKPAVKLVALWGEPAAEPPRLQLRLRARRSLRSSRVRGRSKEDFERELLLCEKECDIEALLDLEADLDGAPEETQASKHGKRDDRGC